MRILFHNVEAATKRRDLRQLAMKETGAVTRRLRWLLPRITLVLSQMDASTGDVNKRCVVEMKSRRTGTVSVTALARDWLTAMTSALRLASRRLSEGWKGRSRALPLARVPTLPMRLAEIG
jgi:hypothetical protein